MSLTPEDIKELRRLLSEATAGTWIDVGDTEPWPGAVIATTGPDGGVTQVCIDPEADDRPADRAWIAAIHNAAPALLTAADDLATLRLEHESWGAVIDGLRATVAEMKAQRDADVMTALMRQLEAFDVTLATVTRERDEARADMADVQARYGRAWEALCSIGESVEAAGYPQLLPERALRVGEGVAKVIAERDELRAALQSLRDVAHMALSGDATAPDVEHQIACADAALAGGKS